MANDIKAMLKELAVAVLEEDAQESNATPVAAPVVESVETESLKTKASSGGNDIKAMLKELAVAVLQDEEENGTDTPTEAPVVESVETESLKTKASSGR